jgi:flavin reductase (DIM6/NTAB) family NADH-FMN oxidoreductase RutF
MTLPASTAPLPETPVEVANLPCKSCDSGRTLAAKGLCCRDFRSTLGSFATGVTVITALAPDGTPIGMTISSFNSVSLEPPLILWSLSLTSPNLEAFRNATYYAVNVLSADQQVLSDRFASRRDDRFSGVDVRPGLGGTPLIEGCCAWFECSHEAYYPGGDHLIFVGHVEQFAVGNAEAPLIFHNARYRQLDAPDPGLNQFRKTVG